MSKAKTMQRRAERDKNAPAGFWRRYPREIGVCAVLAAAIWLVFVQIGAHGLINFNDWDYVGENPAVLSGITWEGVKFAFTTHMTANWHPITWLSHMLDVQLFGLNPGTMHLSSMWLHAANAMLLFALLRYLTGAFWRSAAVAALFAVHPLHVEPVAWLSDRKDLLATFFWLLTALTYGHWAKRGASPSSWRWFALAHVWAAMATMSKPTAVTLPFTLLLIDLWPLARMDSLARRLAEKAGFFLLAAGQGLATYMIRSDISSTTALVDVSFARKFANAVASYGVYLWQTIVPVNLTPMYPFPQGIQWLPVGVAALAIVGVSAVALLRTRQQPYLAAGWFWYLGVLAPMIGLVQVGNQAHADRYTYVSLIGIFWIVVWGMHEWLGEPRWQSGAWRGAVATILLALMWISYAQAALWIDDRALFGHTLRVTGPNRLANTAVGLAHLRARNYTDAGGHLRTALALEPNFIPAYQHLAALLLDTGKADEALPLLDKAVGLAPRAALNYYYRGLGLRATGKLDEALADFERALKIGLSEERAKRVHLELGHVKTSQDKHSEALTHFQKAMEIDPFYYLAEKNLAFSYYRMKDYTTALYWFRQLQAINPADEDVSNALKSIRTQ